MSSDTASPAPLSALRGLLPFLRPYRARVVLAFVLLCLGSAAILVVPLAFRDLIDAGFGGVSVGGASPVCRGSKYCGDWRSTRAYTALRRSAVTRSPIHDTV